MPQLNESYLTNICNAFCDSIYSSQFYHQSVKLDPSFSPALFSYSQILVRKKDYFAAVECLNKVLTTTPDSPDTLSLLGISGPEHRAPI